MLRFLILRAAPLCAAALVLFAAAQYALADYDDDPPVSRSPRAPTTRVIVESGAGGSRSRTSGAWRAADCECPSDCECAALGDGRRCPCRDRIDPRTLPRGVRLSPPPAPYLSDRPTPRYTPRSAPRYGGHYDDYSAPAPYYSAPAPYYSAPAPYYSAPAPYYSAPAPYYRNGRDRAPSYAVWGTGGPRGDYYYSSPRPTHGYPPMSRPAPHSGSYSYPPMPYADPRSACPDGMCPTR